MSNASGTSRLGAGSRANGAIIDTVQRRSADRLAKIAFIVVWATLTPTIYVIAATVTDWWLAAALAVAGGLVIAAVVWLVVLIWPVLRMVWYWAGELAALGLLLAGYWALTLAMPAWAAGLLTVLALGMPVAVPASRRFLTRWAWCAISRHRLRVCFATFIRVNRRGSLPLILLARPTPAGERVWVALRPGLSLEDMTTESGLDRLAVGCWAHEVRLSRAWRRLAPVIRVDITRRNPLSGTVTSPLTTLIPTTSTANGTTRAPVSFDVAGLDLPGVPDQPPASHGATVTAPAWRKPSPRPRNGAPTAAPAPASEDDPNEWI
jgi:hypothetical protein